MVRALIFLSGSAAVVFASRRCLLEPRSHGFYRFFAFELILALILLNVPAWFRQPFSALQLVSWFLLIFAVVPAVEGFRLLHRIGKPEYGKPSGSNFGFENTTRLVTSGIYRFIRHPMYASLLGLTWGACLKDLSALTAGGALVASAFLVLTAVAEERENLARFGAVYADYMKLTRRFVPFVV